MAKYDEAFIIRVDQLVHAIVFLVGEYGGSPIALLELLSDHADINYLYIFRRQ